MLNRVAPKFQMYSGPFGPPFVAVPGQRYHASPTHSTAVWPGDVQLLLARGWVVSDPTTSVARDVVNTAAGALIRVPKFPSMLSRMMPPTNWPAGGKVTVFGRTYTGTASTPQDVAAEDVDDLDLGAGWLYLGPSGTYQRPEGVSIGTAFADAEIGVLVSWDGIAWRLPGDPYTIA